MADSSFGPGWPNCQVSKIVPLVVHGVSFPGGARKELLPLITLLLEEMIRMGYHPKSGQCWGFACRAIKRPDGADSNVPSNHSWGIAFDINSAENTFGGLTHTVPADVVALFKSYGFGWGGDYSGLKDWMHFEYLGSLSKLKADTARAKRNLYPRVTKYEFDGVLYGDMGMAFRHAKKSLSYRKGAHTYRHQNYRLYRSATKKAKIDLDKAKVGYSVEISRGAGSIKVTKREVKQGK